MIGREYGWTADAAPSFLLGSITKVLARRLPVPRMMGDAISVMSIPVEVFSYPVRSAARLVFRVRPGATIAMLSGWIEAAVLNLL
ncbi:hypothetical protein GCM10011507_12430 [Edaphobacter acidisoli]|uniref:Uncharacterized protein n=1 Tax=Edaphobacter acidisoli TaxID=2040573 RepID=A0A916RP14_9BACT|nr:hypothetical protein GCM10011507_12430 [Edaphobacter acidisoli]